MAKEIRSQITIDASPDEVWAILTDFEQYSKWNPFIQGVKGTVQEGSRIQVSIKPPNGGGMKFKPVILKMTKGKELRWLGSLIVKGLFDGEHRFELSGNGDGTTTFIQAERFTGVLAGLFNTDKTKAGFELMNAKLKELAEKGLSA